MTVYNPQNENHRQWVAQNIISMASKWGFKAVEHEGIWETVMEKQNAFNDNVKIIIYTSVDKKTNSVRDYAEDRIRIVVQNGDVFQRVKRINRTGEFKAITDRMIEGILEAQKVK